jgi:hypothetical protein
MKSKFPHLEVNIFPAVENDLSFTVCMEEKHMLENKYG